jgi:hypothetical protein
MKKLKIVLVVLITGVSFSFAQINAPSESPAASVSTKIGIADVKIEYSRPSVKGRTIFGDLVPFGKPWRTGANAPTKITFSDTVIVAGKKLNPATYSLYTIPAETEWTIILGNKPSVPAWSHKDEDDAVRFTVPSSKTCSKIETFTISIDNVTKSNADVVLSWENTSVSFKIENDYHKKVLADIKNKIENIDTYYQAANYLYNTDTDLKTALEYVNKVLEKNPKYWIYNLKAKILLKLKDCKGAKEAISKSNELAKAANDLDYIKINEKVISDCK